MPRGRLVDRLEQHAVSITWERMEGGSWVEYGPYDVFIDFSPSGSLLATGEGLTGKTGSIPCQMLSTVPLEVGDDFVVDGQQYRVEYVSPEEQVPSGGTMKMAWLSAQRQHGAD